MNSRIPYYILAVLVLVAIIWRMANPPPPPPPGPMGKIPTWDSMTKIGDMSAFAVDPAGKLWAGAWNQKTRHGKLHSAVWIIGMENLRLQTCRLPMGYFTESVWWDGEKSLRALIVDSDDPAHADKAKIVEIDPSDGSIMKTKPVSEVVAAMLDCSGRSCLARLPEGSKAGFALLYDSGSKVDHNIDLDPPTNPGTNVPGKLGTGQYPRIVLAADETAKGKDAYYAEQVPVADLREAQRPKRLFGLDDLPGRVEGMWVAEKGVLMVVSERDKFHEIYYDSVKNKLLDLSKPENKIDVAATWPDAPKEMMFVTFTGGYKLTLATAKVKRLMDFTTLGRNSLRWRPEVQDGRLYPREDGDYTGVALAANTIDIRVINKDGTVGPDILPRR